MPEQRYDRASTTKPGGLHEAVPAPAPKRRRPIETYLALNKHAMWSDVERYLRRVALPPPAANVAWHAEAQFIGKAIDYLRGIDLFIGRAPLRDSRSRSPARR